jgi:hypothetical protein
MLGSEAARSARRKVKLGSRPHLLIGTMVGTLAVFVLFLRHYTNLQSDNCARKAHTNHACMQSLATTFPEQ